MSDCKAKVLVVEDSPTNLDILVGLLRDYDVMVALDGPTALAILERETPDVILLDIVMPGMDGFEVCDRIKGRAEWRDIPILFITAKTDEPSIVHAFDVGGSDYVAKPFRSKELLARVRIQVEYRRAMDQLRTMAVTDALTGLPNRRAFFNDGMRLFNEARARSIALSAMMLDIDHFKRINDRFGHACGDEVLRQVARAIRTQVRGRDLCARVGGEEMALLVPGVDEAPAVALAERLRSQLEALLIDTPQGQVAVTVSIGVAPLRPDSLSLDDLLARADDRLYEAKRNGRNRVCPPPAPIPQRAESAPTAASRQTAPAGLPGLHNS
jgi:two-component system, cell cycle response regulator